MRMIGYALLTLYASSLQASAEVQIGQDVYTKGGSRYGKVHMLVVGTDGSVQELLVRSRGFFGFGARCILIEKDQYEFAGGHLRLVFSRDGTSRLPSDKRCS